MLAMCRKISISKTAFDFCPRQQISTTKLPAVNRDKLLAVDARKISDPQGLD